MNSDPITPAPPADMSQTQVPAAPAPPAEPAAAAPVEAAPAAVPGAPVVVEPTSVPEPAAPVPTTPPDTSPAPTDTPAEVTSPPATPAPPEPPAAPTGPTVTTIKPTAEPSSEKSADGLKRILLVEDDDALAQVYMTRLQAEGFDVKRTPNGEDALATAIQYKPDLVLLDVMMPKVSGFDVLDIMRNTPETANIKVIMLTALSQESDKERATKLGADDYLVKSQVVIADVVDRIRHHLDISAPGSSPSPGATSVAN